MSANPHLLDRLATLTSIRDLELLEFSLLKTVYELFRPEQVTMLKYDSDGEIRFSMRYGHDGCHESHRSGRHRDLDQPEVLSALRMARRISAPYHSRLANGNSLSAFPVLDFQVLSVCLIVESRRPGAPNDVRLVQGLLQIYRNFCQLIEDAQRDQLTGLLNRKTFDESIQRVIGMSAALQFPMIEGERRQLPDTEVSYWLGLIDIDNFKLVNDSLGHIYGDEVLLLLSQIMRDSFRESDLLFRFGGEEFVVITENIDIQGAKTAFERFRLAVEKFNFPQVGQVTVSFGAVEVHAGDVVHAVLDKADKALYFAKQHGKNRVCFYDELLEQGQIQPTQSFMNQEAELF
ncbi:MAG: GGDEF domain-containing protein [Nitrincola lacisaponensis]|uniref:diguanylate cyclase n=1 Tax=Nitrincola lacisaponensis TaxID=267850 RepID=A0A063Y1S4_9GAMM|nr:GGDEF domain-containing protein [Nitrincola lacisaponensis]KDE39105.1 GGDEF family protein [Nitrincola lacisaponensis]